MTEELDPKLLLDKEFRMQYFYKIRNKQAKLITFKKNRAQDTFDKQKHTRNIVLKSRQLGFTTYEAIDMLDDALFFPNFNGLFIAQDLDVAKDIFANKIYLAWTLFPSSLKQLYGVDTDTARQLKFDAGEGAIGTIVVDSSGRSGTFDRVHVTELALVVKKFPQVAQEIIEGTIPAVPTTGRIDIESTAEGEFGWFHDIFWEAWNRGEPTRPVEFKAHFFNWQYDDEELESVVPEEVPSDFEEYQGLHKLSDREITYYYHKWLSLEKDWDLLHKHYPTTPEEAFIYSGHKLFNMPQVIAAKKYLLDLIEGGKIEAERQGDWVFIKPPRLGHRYGMGADVAEGVGQDSSTAVIWDFTPIKPETVAIYASNKVPPDLFSFELKNGGERYQMATIAVERNSNMGGTTIAKLEEIYPIQRIYKDKKGKLGWETNLVTRPRMIYEFNTAFNNELVDVLSKKLLTEMQMYDREDLLKSKFDPNATNHFDILMAAAIGFQLRNESLVDEIITPYIPKWAGYGKRA